MRLQLILLFLLLIGFNACSNKNTFPKEPQITLKSVTPSSVKEGSEDAFKITVLFTDGDADFGNTDPTQMTNDIFLTDSRDGTTEEYQSPVFDGGIIDPDKGLEGSLEINVSAVFLLLDSLHKTTGDTVQYDIYIQDKKGNKSNIVSTPPLYITPS